MLLLLKDAPVLQIRDNGECRILDFLYTRGDHSSI